MLWDVPVYTAIVRGGALGDEDPTNEERLFWDLWEGGRRGAGLGHGEVPRDEYKLVIWACEIISKMLRSRVGAFYVACGTTRANGHTGLRYSGVVPSSPFKMAPRLASAMHNHASQV